MLQHIHFEKYTKKITKYTINYKIDVTEHRFCEVRHKIHLEIDNKRKIDVAQNRYGKLRIIDSK